MASPNHSLTNYLALRPYVLERSRHYNENDKEGFDNLLAAYDKIPMHLLLNKRPEYDIKGLEKVFETFSKNFTKPP